MGTGFHSHVSGGREGLFAPSHRKRSQDRKLEYKPDRTDAMVDFKTDASGTKDFPYVLQNGLVLKLHLLAPYTIFVG